jgi:hypothetical protein
MQMRILPTTTYPYSTYTWVGIHLHSYRLYRSRLHVQLLLTALTKGHPWTRISISSKAASFPSYPDELGELCGLCEPHQTLETKAI